jgi:phosphonate transport system substrate-binding protein
LRTRRTVCFLAGALAATLGLGGCDRLHVRQAPDHIAFSVPPRDDARDLERRWKPLLDDMQAQTGLKVSPYFAPGYDPAVEALKLDRVQAGLFSNTSGLAAARRGGGEVFASVDLAPGVGFASVLMVRADRPITLDQVLHCGRRFSFGLGVPGSTSATLAPVAELFAPHGIEPNACFKVVRRAGHKANILSVVSGDLDLAVSDTAALAMAERDDPKIAGEIKVLWTSPPLPPEPLLWRRDLDPSVKEKLRAFFLGYGKAPGAEGERQRKVLAGLGFGAFQPADDSHFLPVREMQAKKELLDARNAHDARAAHAAESELARIRRAEARAAAEGGRARSAAPSSVELQGVSGRSGG